MGFLNLFKNRKKEQTINDLVRELEAYDWLKTRNAIVHFIPKYRSVSVSIHSNKNSGILASAYSHDMNIAGAVEEVKTLVEASKEE